MHGGEFFEHVVAGRVEAGIAFGSDGNRFPLGNPCRDFEAEFIVSPVGKTRILLASTGRDRMMSREYDLKVPSLLFVPGQ